MSNKIVPGDLIFFLKCKPKAGNSVKETFVDAVCSSSKVNAQVFHVGLFLEESTIVHATTSYGVIKEPLFSALSSIKPDIIEIHRINVEEDRRKKAISFALESLGAEYNDIFSPSCVNSKGKKAFYCCQLIYEAFGRNLFNSHTLNFLDSKGEIIDFWNEYFKERKHAIPQGLPGSHPSVLKSSKCLTLIKTVEAKNFCDRNNNIFQ